MCYYDSVRNDSIASLVAGSYGSFSQNINHKGGLLARLADIIPHRPCGFFMASYDYGKKEIVEWIHRNFAQGASCLDVGACDGKYADLLGDYLVMDACEIFVPNIWNNRLDQKYRKVFNCDIVDLPYEHYDLIIFGDVIEHMTVENAQKALAYALPRCKDLIVGVPYLYAQGAIYGNKYEIHLQDDLTEAVFAERYPDLKMLYNTGKRYAYYHK